MEVKDFLKPKNQEKMTAILGGGIAGLSAAYYALENPRIAPLIIYEASNRLGGWIRTDRSKTGAIFEKGPRTVRPSGDAGRNTLHMIDDLNLTEKIIPVASSHPSAKNRLIYVDKKLHILPNSFGSFFRVKSPFKRPLITALINDLRAPKGVEGDESMYSFVERRLGKDVADYLISSMLCGICAGDAKKISVNFLLKSMVEYEQKDGSIVKGVVKEFLGNFRSLPGDEDIKMMEEEVRTNVGSVKRSEKEKWSVWGLQGGLEQLPLKLEENLLAKNVKIERNAGVKSLTFGSDFVEVEVEGEGEVKRHERVVSSLPAGSIGRLVEKQHPELAEELRGIPSVDVVVLNVEYPGKVLPMEAFGFLVPPVERVPILGVIFDSCVFPQKESTVLTVMMGGAWFDEYFSANSSKNYLESLALDQLRKILEIKVDPLDINTSILGNCIPQYIVGHNDRIKRIRNYISSHKLPLVLCGSSYQGVGINDVILSAKQAVYDIS